MSTPSQPSPSRPAAAPRATKSAAEAPTLYNFFAPGGVLSKAHPAYEFRRGQLEMAQAVEQALGEKRHLIVEAGTGTGKTLAYLLPVIRAGKRVILSTGTKTLQEQLFHKDIPFLEKNLFPDGKSKLRVCYMKGRGNYLCRQKLYDLTDKPVLSGLEEIDQYRVIAEWEKTTGRAARELRRYEVLGMCKIATIISLGYHLFRSGRATDPRFEAWGAVVSPFLDRAARFAR